ncbi:MAG: hypothetical protein U9N54_06935 [candidate division Zixibacteria bacterium]|nr:hypothetical protein [candidate division Zixibacteria bacterium]
MWKFILVLLLLATTVIAADILYPSGYDFDSQYQINDQAIFTTDTLIISRTFSSNESFTIDGFYFSENIPDNFVMQNYTLTLNGNSISHDYDNTQISEFVGNNCYYWIIDDPSGATQNSINQGDEILLELKLTCDIAGDYILPMHTNSFYGNQTPFFATDNEILITVTNPTDTIPPGPINDLSVN